MVENDIYEVTPILSVSDMTTEHGDVLLRALRINVRLGKGEVSAIVDHPEIASRFALLPENAKSEFTGLLVLAQNSLENESLSSGQVRRLEGEQLLALANEWDAGGRVRFELPLTLSRNLVYALDMHARLGIGQFRVEEHPVISDILSAAWEKSGHSLQNKLRWTLLNARSVVMPELKGGEGHSYGIHSKSVSDEARVAWDLMQVVRNTASWHRHRAAGGTGATWQTNFDEPWRSSAQPLPTAEVNQSVPQASPVP